MWLDTGEQYRQWAAQQLGIALDNGEAIATGYGDQMCVVVVHNWTPTTQDCELSVASTGKGWANRTFLRACFEYVFNQLDCRRCTARVQASNAASVTMTERLGFTREGTLRRASRDGGDLHVFGMLKTECRWIDGKA